MRSFLEKFSGKEEQMPMASIFHERSETEHYCSICLNLIRCGGYRKLPECGALMYMYGCDRTPTCPLSELNFPFHSVKINTRGMIS